ncbi:hypothetical protein ABID39_000271 [Bartonella japonica]|uniref:Uncharacterized protein n=1 Tax=Bartonella japonica TaxID=357761 RepID=A0ABV2FLZ8_9HYPH
MREVYETILHVESILHEQLNTNICKATLMNNDGLYREKECSFYSMLKKSHWLMSYHSLETL